jgi:hypothetical protein
MRIDDRVFGPACGVMSRGRNRRRDAACDNHRYRGYRRNLLRTHIQSCCCDRQSAERHNRTGHAGRDVGLEQPAILVRCTCKHERHTERACDREQHC